MIPSLVVTEIRDALVEYLASTFALSDDDVRDALSAFLTDNADGIFRGPYLRVRTPFRPVAADWTPSLDWLPPGFVPHAHQATAFDRLSTAGGHEPQPTLVTTGTGSGKTECFLYPILDHCARQRAVGAPGIKALILYPMNALASDQAGRLAELIHTHSELTGLTAGLYVGGDGRHPTMGADHLIDRRDALRSDPPDILLTNYKMLDFLLLRREDHDLWATNTPTTLRYVVLDEFHTYDGAQGTDVAMLLRRLGRTLGMAAPGWPLGTATPVATSATLGTGPDALAELRQFATKVFGVAFDDESTIGETRQDVDEACDTTDYFLPIPTIDDVRDAGDDIDAVAAAFCRRDDPDAPGPIDPTDPIALGSVLLRHPLTRAVLHAVGDRPRTWTDAVDEIKQRIPDWGRAAMVDPAGVELALGRFVWLLSLARRSHAGHHRPLFSVEVQLWIREVSRLLRSVTADAHFRWRDTAAAGDDDHQPPSPELPAVYCRRCGMSGWMAIQSEVADTLLTSPTTIYGAALERRPTIRTLLRCHPDDPAARRYDPHRRTYTTAEEPDGIAVLVTPDEDAARANQCPGCGERNAIRFVGLQVASLASVSINTLFSSHHLDDEERKLLAFTDSVQDASHRASFFAGRTHRINLRTLMASIIAEQGHLSLADLGDELLDRADTPRQRFELVPPDLVRHPAVRSTWTDDPHSDGLDLLRSRLGFETDIEFGLRSRVGRTLELSFVAAARVEPDEVDTLVTLLHEDLRHLLGEVPAGTVAAVPTYLRGLLARIRLQGALVHPLLGPYIDEDGAQWRIWGGRPDGLPPFTPGQGRPSFYTTAPNSRGFDPLGHAGANPTWILDWATRSLGLDPGHARTVNSRALPLLAEHSDTIIATTAGNGSRVFGLDRRHVIVHDLTDPDQPGGVRCALCGTRHPTPHDQVDAWVGTPCLRYRCPGTFEPDPPPVGQYYRGLYRSGGTRRVVTGEHTGLLTRARREDLETAFKTGTAPDAPNVLTATPTLEMGIDIGDLSTVMLTSVPPTPANYVQRVGRAGRRSGNSLVTTFVRTDTHGLYYLADPDAMISGDVRPPNCYLDARETLGRQYLAYLLDRVADRTIDAPPLPREIGAVMAAGLDEGSLLRVLVDASRDDPTHIDTFLALFGDHLEDRTGEHLRDFAATGVESTIKGAHDQWHQRQRELALRQRRLGDAITRLQATAAGDPDTDEELRSLRGQRQANGAMMREHRREYVLTALERLGLLPNYTLVDDVTTLVATTWSRDDDGNYETEIDEYGRSAQIALTELAPGNTFYAGGHRHHIDTIDIGPADNPHYEQWRLCPECGYGTLDIPDSVPDRCPRCGTAAIVDNGSLHTMVRLRTVHSLAPEEAARVYDEEDDRVREHYDVATLVDVDPAHVSGAWALTGPAFGAELAGVTHLRTINLGFADRRGEQRMIAGDQRHLTRFTVCRNCGAVEQARRAQARDRPERLHHGWCKSRQGASSWDDVVLYHQLTTEAVRLLLPVSMFEVDERLASFKGALLLGLRSEFGGDPDHLRIVRSEMPNHGGLGRRQFLVLYDSVPGGTGYLARLADPDRVRRLLDDARTVISRCPCRNEGRPACHRCLLGVVGRHEYDLARRDLALEILDDLLGQWEPDHEIPTVAGIDIGRVEESELERRFKAALQDWSSHPHFEHVSLLPAAASGPYEAYDLRIRDGDELVRWRIEEQATLDTTPPTQPDFLFRRMDTTSPEIAVYLDGYQFHASPDINNLADDATKRTGVRHTGRLVWNLTWNDVDLFHQAVTSEIRRDPPPRPLLAGAGKNAAQQVHRARGGRLDASLLHLNPMSLLLEYLIRPDPGDWERLALSAVAGAAASATPVPVRASELRGVIERALAGEVPASGQSDGGDGEVVVQCFGYLTDTGMTLSLVLDSSDPNSERWTAIATLADDRTSVGQDEHRARWHAWHQWANLLQFLRGDGRDPLVVTTGIAAEAAAGLNDLWIAGRFADRVAATDGVAEPVGSSEPEATPRTKAVTLSPAMEEEVDLLEDDDVRRLVEQVLARGAPDFVAGGELPDGTPVEALWPDQQVGIVGANDDLPSPDGWDLRRAEAWNVDALIEAMGVDA